MMDEFPSVSEVGFDEKICLMKAHELEKVLRVLSLGAVGRRRGSGDVGFLVFWGRRRRWWW